MYYHIIWDFDGTLFDTYPLMTIAFAKTLETEGYSENPAQIMELMKVSELHLLEYCKNKYGTEEDFKYRYDRIRKEMYKNIRPFPEIPGICKAIYLSGKMNYLYTHRSHSAIDILKNNNLHIYFKDFITRENHFKRKPAPDALLYLIEEHRMNKDEILMIGDRTIDILAAKNAGIKGCYFNEDRTGKCDLADYTIYDFKELYEIIGLNKLQYL